MNSIRNIDYKMNEFDFDKTLITIHKRTIKNNQKYYSILTSVDCSLNMHNKCYVNHMMFKFRKKKYFCRQILRAEYDVRVLRSYDRTYFSFQSSYLFEIGVIMNGSVGS